MRATPITGAVSDREKERAVIEAAKVVVRRYLYKAREFGGYGDTAELQELRRAVLALDARVTGDGET